MKSYIVFALLVAAAVAYPADKDATILGYENNNVGFGDFKYGYQTSDGQSATVQGTLKNAGTENEATELRGQYSYIGPDGVTYTVTYTADEFGFHPSAAHLPVGPTV